MTEWHRLLNPRPNARSLLGTIHPNSGGFIICRVDQYDRRSFAHFPTIIDVAKLIMNTPSSQHAFHEGILEKRAQRVRFDLDLDLDKLPNGKELHSYGQWLLDTLLDHLRRACQSFFQIDLSYEKDLIITTSHGPEKFSVHVIVETLVLANSHQVQHFAKIVVSDKIFEEALHARIIDMAIYKTTQFFRLLGSRRQVGGTRLKVLSSRTPREFTKPADSKREQLLLIVQALQATMITAVNMIRVRTISVPEVVSRPPRELTKTDEVAMRQAVDEYYPGVYKFREYSKTSDGLSFERNFPSECYACGRPHEKIGLLVILLGRKIVSYCGINPEKIGILIGELPRPATEAPISSPLTKKLLPDADLPDVTELSLEENVPVSINYFESSDEIITKQSSSREIWLHG